MTKPRMTVTVPTDAPCDDTYYNELYKLNYGDRFDVLVLRAGDLPTSVSVPAGICPDCGRDLRTDMRDVDPRLLCGLCKDQYDALNDCDIPFDGSTPQSVVEASPVSMWQDSRDAAF